MLSNDHCRLWWLRLKKGPERAQRLLTDAIARPPPRCCFRAHVFLLSFVEYHTTTSSQDAFAGRQITPSFKSSRSCDCHELQIFLVHPPLTCFCSPGLCVLSLPRSSSPAAFAASRAYQSCDSLTETVAPPVAARCTRACVYICGILSDYPLLFPYTFTHPPTLPLSIPHLLDTDGGVGGSSSRHRYVNYLPVKYLRQ